MRMKNIVNWLKIQLKTMKKKLQRVLIIGIILITVFFSFVFMMWIPEDFLTVHLWGSNRGFGLLIIYFLFSCLIAGISWLVCRQNRWNILFVPVLFNLLWILGLFDPSLWEHDAGIVVSSGIALSVIASVLGMLKAIKSRSGGNDRNPELNDSLL
jgi:hypothetical protein